MKTLTACTLDCPDACSLVVETDNTGVKHILGNPDHPITSGFSCAKMRRFGNRLRSPNRITRPLLKKKGQWKKIGGGINQFIEAGLTDMGNCAPFYQQYVRLEN